MRKVRVARNTKRKLYCVGPPEMEVLWWMLFQMTQSSCPVVTDLPIVKVSFASNAFISSFSTFIPSALFGR